MRAALGARAGAWALVLLLALPTVAAAYPTVILTGKTFMRRTLPETVLLPDGTFFRIGDLRIRLPAARPKETLLYDVGTGVLERCRGQTPRDVLRRKGFGLSFVSARSPKRGTFERPKKLSATLDGRDVLLVVTEAPFLSPRGR